MNGEPGRQQETNLPDEAEAAKAKEQRVRWNGGLMTGMKKMVLGAALAVGALGMTAAPAQAAVRFGVAIGGPVAYVPPCPGPGYAWINGYWTNGAWIQGYWRAPAVGFGARIGGPAYHFDHGPYDRGYDRGNDHFRAPNRFRR